MKVLFSKLIIVFILVLVGCSSGSESSAIVPIDLTDEVTISNGDFDLTIYEINEIESKSLGDREIKLKKDAKEKYNLYEIRMHYTNLMDEPGKLSYQQLWVSLPDVEDSSDSLIVVGFCEPRANNPKGMATFCAIVPPPKKPGTYGVSGVFQASPLLIQPDDQADYYLIIILEKGKSEVEISFLESE
jgi:hypothetical protein